MLLQRKSKSAAASRLVESEYTAPLTLSYGSMDMIERRIDFQNNDIYVIVGAGDVRCLVCLAPSYTEHVTHGTVQALETTSRFSFWFDERPPPRQSLE
jgi:hypothetical protein